MTMTSKYSLTTQNENKQKKFNTTKHALLVSQDLTIIELRAHS